MHSTERPASLARALAADVPQATRAKGASYFRAGAVASLVTFKDRVVATVRGTREYEVELAREQDGFIGSCRCPYFEDRFAVCKHIWAVILAADERGALPPLAPRSWIEPVDTPGAHEEPEFAPPAPRQQPRGARREPWEALLEGLAQDPTAREAARPVSRHTNTVFLYVIETVPSDYPDGVPIEVLGRKRKKSGEWGKPQPAGVAIDEIDRLPAADREILALLNGAAETSPSAPYYASNPARARFRLAAPLLDRVLPLIAGTGRLHVWDTAGASPELVPLEWDDGPPWTFRLDVSAAGTDAITVDGALLRGATRLELPAVTFLVSDRYVIAGRQLARLDAGGAASWLRQLRNTGPTRFPQTAAPQLVEALAHARVPPESLPGELRYAIVRVPPRPRVRVRRASGPNPYARRDDLEAVAEFDYDAVVVPADGRASTYDAERRRLIVRAPDAEQTALARLQQLGFRRAWSYEGKRDDLLVAVEQFPRAVRTLVREGWYVEADGRAFRAPRAIAVQVKSGIDWFELHGQVDFGDGRSASIAGLLAALRRGDGTIVLDDGTRGMVPEEWLDRYLRFAGFGEAEGDHIRYRRSQTALLDALLETQPAVSFDETFARARAELKTFSGIRALNPPETFKGTLREYQREALGWFEFLRRFGFGGCLADDMGLGKTVMVLALLEGRRVERGRGAHVREHHGAGRPSLAVVPRSLVFNWKEEAARFAPELRVLDYTGAARNPAAIPEHDLVLTTYGTLRRDAPQLTDFAFDYVILDEAQAIKNAATAAAKAVRLLRGRHRLALSGTPIENHVGELWSLFDFLNPGLLGTARAFKTATTVQSRGAPDDLALVTHAVRPLILRRTKAQVEPQLPPRTEQTIGCELDAPQRRFYDELRAHYRATLLRRVARSGLARSRMQVLEALLRLRQAACHPGLVDVRRLHESSAKLDALLPQLAEVVEEGHKALVFSQFTSFLALVRDRLDEHGLVYEYLDGQTRDREARVHRFNTDDGCRVFLISLKAGGVGLNLTAAEYVFLLDPWWNPAVEAQAIDRAHRIGQEKHVFAYRLIAQDTVEEKVAQLQQSKRELADAILTADPALIRNLSAEDLDWLLS